MSYWIFINVFLALLAAKITERVFIAAATTFFAHRNKRKQDKLTRRFNG